MKLIKQTISDLWKEIGWLVFYSFICSLVLISLVFIFVGLKQQLDESSGIRRFLYKNIQFTDTKNLDFNKNIFNTNELRYNKYLQQKDLDSIEYFKKIFSEESQAGFFATALSTSFISYDEVYLLVGLYSEMSDYSFSKNDEISFAVSYDLKDSKKDNISVEGSLYPLHLAPEKMQIFHPTRYVNSNFRNTLFIFVRDYNICQKLLPADLIRNIDFENILSSTIFKNWSDQQVEELRDLAYKKYNLFLSINSIDNYQISFASYSFNSVLLYFIFSIITFITFIIVMLLNIYRILLRKMPDYIIYHMFGASNAFIFARILLFAILYNIAPIIIFILYCQFASEYISSILISIFLISMLASVLLICTIAYRHFSKLFSHGIRSNWYGNY